MFPLSEISSITANMPGIDYAPDIMRGKFSKDIADRVQIIPSHHLAHAYTAYWPSGFDEALVLVADAVITLTEETSGWHKPVVFCYTGRGTKLGYYTLNASKPISPSSLTTRVCLRIYLSQSRILYAGKCRTQLPRGGKADGTRRLWRTANHGKPGFTRRRTHRAYLFLPTIYFLKSRPSSFTTRDMETYFRPWLVTTLPIRFKLSWRMRSHVSSQPRRPRPDSISSVLPAV